MKTFLHQVVHKRSLLILCGVLLLSIYTSTTWAQSITQLSTTKSLYNPGEAVSFKVSTNQTITNSFLRIRYYHLSAVLSIIDLPFSGTSVTWTWQTPGIDHRGYLVSVELRAGSSLFNRQTVGVNVSTDAKRFPIYGFLSKYPSMTDWEMDVQMEKLNRYHINWIQYYDWMDTHHDPLAGTPANPATSWNDLANRPTYFETIKGYVDRGHNNYNMKSMYYNLVYGSYSNVLFDPARYLYRDVNHTQIWSVGMPGGWESPALNMMNYWNTDWKNYFMNNLTEVYGATNLHFDGWHMDQLGDWGYMYNNSGQQVDVAQTFPVMIEDAKQLNPSKALIMNAVNTYGQSLIASKPVEMLYTELWDGYQDYGAFRRVIETNEGYNASLQNVFAAYVGRSRSGSAGEHSTGAVLLANATIFSLGGSHIELGEHLLCNEYFPNSNLSMSASLQTQLTAYYDFMVAYENILRDGRSFNGVTLSGDGAQYWPPVKGKIATVGVSWKGNQIFHCLNYTNATTLNWQDDQPVPVVRRNVSMSFPFTTPVTRMWVASPDLNGGVPTNISFKQVNGVVTFKLPSIQYWTMVVAETGSAPAARIYDDRSTIGEEEGELIEYVSSPFQDKVNVHLRLPLAGAVVLDLIDMNGKSVKQKHTDFLDAGSHLVDIATVDIGKGMYILSVNTTSGQQSKRVVKIE